MGEHQVQALAAERGRDLAVGRSGKPVHHGEGGLHARGSRQCEAADLHADGQFGGGCIRGGDDQPTAIRPGSDFLRSVEVDPHRLGPPADDLERAQRQQDLRTPVAFGGGGRVTGGRFHVDIADQMRCDGLGRKCLAAFVRQRVKAHLDVAERHAIGRGDRELQTLRFVAGQRNCQFRTSTARWVLGGIHLAHRILAPHDITLANRILRALRDCNGNRQVEPGSITSLSNEAQLSRPQFRRILPVPSDCLAVSLRRRHFPAAGIQERGPPIGGLSQSGADALPVGAAREVGQHADVRGTEAAAIQEHIVEPRLALGAPQKDMRPDLADRLFGVVHLGRILPAVCAACPGGGLAPPRRAIVVDHVQKQTVVPSAPDVLRLAPAADNDRPLVGLVVADHLRDPHSFLVARRFTAYHEFSGLNLGRVQRIPSVIGRPRSQAVRGGLLEPRVDQFVGQGDRLDGQDQGNTRQHSVALHGCPFRMYSHWPSSNKATRSFSCGVRAAALA